MNRTKNIFYFILILSFVGICSSKTHASALDGLYPDYSLGKSYAHALLLSGHFGYSQYKKISDPILEKRIQKIQKLLLKNQNERYRYSNIKIILIQGVENEPNAFSLGPVVLVTKSLGDLLNDLELTAVIAHEFAHSNKAHFLARIPMPLGSLALEIGKFLMAPSKEKAKSFISRVQANLEDVHLATEMQADCLAANQLKALSARGYPNSPEDLISATNTMYGMDVTTIEDDYGDPGIIRAKHIRNGIYDHIGCHIF